jgi:hypothetical protein
MKTQKKLTLLLFMAIGMQSSLLMAQHHDHKEATLARPASGWNPVKIADDGSNERN